MIIGNKLLKKQSSFSYSKVYQHTKGRSFSEKKALCKAILPQMTAHFCPKQVPVALPPLFIPLLIVLCIFSILLTKTIKNPHLFWKYCELLSVKRKMTLSFHWEFAVVTVFVGQLKREKLSFRSYPSLFRGELKTKIITLRKETPKPYISPPSFSSPKKIICIPVTFRDCLGLLLTDALWKSDCRGTRSAPTRPCQCGLG